MGLSFLPFRGVRFNEKRFRLGDVISPPYDVFTPEMEKRLRRLPANAVHLELPAGKGALRYLEARRLWERWLKSATLVSDPEPAFYVVEQRFALEGKSYARTGVLGALGLRAASAGRILRHERTLPKPKADRTRVLKAMRVNTSPVFAVFPDAAGAVRRVLAQAKRRAPLDAGKDAQGTHYRLWRLDDPAACGKISRALAARKLLIADGHHRFEVARDYWKIARRPGADAVLAYLAAEEDAGLIVHPTHRVAAADGAILRAVSRRAAVSPVPGLKGLEKRLRSARTPYAFGFYDGELKFLTPKPGDRGVLSGFGLDWLARSILRRTDPQAISYYHGSREALRAARKKRALAFIGAPFGVTAIRRAVERAGLLPQKSTYFYPKIGSGLVFRPF